jgi:PAS domain S-box-containing protein
MRFTADRLGTLLFDLVPCAVAVIDRDFHIVAANPCFTESYGQWEGRHCYEVFKRQHRPCDPCVALQTFQDAAVHATEERGVRVDGRQTFFEVKTAPILDAAGQVEFVMEMSVDISKFRKLESQHRLLFERVPCFVTVIDRDYKIVDANWRHQETFGDARGMHCYQTYIKREKPCDSCPARRTFADGRVHTHQQEALDKNGETVHFVVHCAPIHDEFDEISHVIEMATDITPLVQMQRDLLRAESAAAVDKAMGILGLAVEQLRCGLGETIAKLQGGLERDDPALARAACGALQDRLDHLAAVGAVLDAADQAGTASVADLLGRVVGAFAGRETIPLRTRVAEGLAGSLGAPRLIGACLICMVWEYIASSAPYRAGDGHYLLVEAGPGGDGALLFTISHQGASLIEDQGAEPAPEAPPTGMGLVAVKWAVEARGGALSFISRPGHGIVFQLELPGPECV